MNILFVTVKLMRKLGIYLIVISGAILIAPFMVDQLFFFFFIGKIPFTNIHLSAISMVIFWAATIPLAIILRKSLSVLVWKIIDVASELTQRRINRTFRQFTPDRKNELALVATYLLYQTKKSEPGSNIEPQKLAPSLT